MLGLGDMNADQLASKLEETLPVIRSVSEQFKDPASILKCWGVWSKSIGCCIKKKPSTANNATIANAMIVPVEIPARAAAVLIFMLNQADTVPKP